jgi:hypothetical protein
VSANEKRGPCLKCNHDDHPGRVCECGCDAFARCKGHCSWFDHWGEEPDFFADPKPPESA